MNKKLVTMLFAITLIMSAASIEAKESENLASMTDISISGPTVSIPPIPPVDIPPIPPVDIPPIPPVVIPPIPPVVIPPIPPIAQEPPSAEAIAFAQRTGGHLTNMLLAALVKVIGDTTPENVEEGNLAIGLMFSDSQTNFRLVGTFDPLSDNDYPQDDFEETGLAKALAGQQYTDVQRVGGKWFYRSSIPLSNFVPQCAMCHPNFASFDSTDNVGALMLKVPIKRS